MNISPRPGAACCNMQIYVSHVCVQFRKVSTSLCAIDVVITAESDTCTEEAAISVDSTKIRLAGFSQHIGENQADRLAARQKTLALIWAVEHRAALRATCAQPHTRVLA